MNIAVELRYMDMKLNTPWDDRFWIGGDYFKIAERFGVGMTAIMTERGADEICECCDGLIIPGSANNIDPKYYGMPNSGIALSHDEYALDAVLMRHFIERGKPVFGICGGHQALNIYLGGTIKRMDDPVNHCNQTTRTHKINIVKGSFVYDVYQRDSTPTNSWHGWEIGKLAEPLSIAATTDDGVIEAVENREMRAFAVQWHPELSLSKGDPMEHAFFYNFFKCCADAKKD